MKPFIKQEQKKERKCEVWQKNQHSTANKLKEEIVGSKNLGHKQKAVSKVKEETDKISARKRLTLN